MPIPKDFIEVHAQFDGKPASIRSESIDAVIDNDAYQSKDSNEKRPACVTVCYGGGRSLDVTESYAEIMDMIWNAEL